jgi:Putative transposase DNA-binding domain
VLNQGAGRRHNRRTRDWSIGHLIQALADKAAQAGIIIKLVDERGTSSTCPACRQRVPRPAGRVLTCPHCTFTGHRDLVAAASIAARAGGGTTPAITVPAGVTHRRAGNHLPGVSRARRDPRRRPHHGRARGSPGRHRPALPSPPRAGTGGESLALRRGPRKHTDELTERCTKPAQNWLAAAGKLLEAEAARLAAGFMFSALIDVRSGEQVTLSERNADLARSLVWAVAILPANRSAVSGLVTVAGRWRGQAARAKLWPPAPVSQSRAGTVRVSRLPMPRIAASAAMRATKLPVTFVRSGPGLAAAACVVGASAANSPAASDVATAARPIRRARPAIAVIACLPSPPAMADARSAHPRRGARGWRRPPTRCSAA